ncbi:MAG: hypothetical protein Q9216_001617 [Gyalolechia sp. 2 TL-2023]
MAITNASLLSWSTNAVFYGLIVLSIYHFKSHVSFTDVSIIQSFTGIPPADLAIRTRSWVSRTLLPGAWRDPYKPLSSSKWIRLCTIHRPKNDGFHFVLEKFLLDSAPPYRALSYTWGPAEGGFVPHDGDRVNLLVNGRNRSLPANLIIALLNLSDGDLSGYYWIDALCIDQLNDKERSEQVMVMDKIFQRAAAVNVWLGKGYPDTQKLNNIIQDLVDHQGQEHKWATRPKWSTGEDLLLPSDWETLVQIFSRRWFHRLWTLQEYVLAKEVSVFCGNVTIDMVNLLKAGSFLSEHQIPMKLSYGKKKETINPPVLAMSSLQRVVQGHEILELDFLKCFSTSTASPQIDYETLLVWVYWRSIAKIATDPRDYIFGIAGVANTLAKKLGLQYEPLRIDYSLSTSQAFQAFIMRIMKGRFGIRAVSIVRQSTDVAIQRSYNVRTEGLPSWVPDLANRNGFGLSTHGGLQYIGAGSVCQNVLGQHSTADRHQSLTVTGSALHVYAHRIGKIQKVSRVFPNVLDIECGNFILSLTPLLIRLPAVDPKTSHTPIEALLDTLRVDVDPETIKHALQAFDQVAFERFLVEALQLFVWTKALPPYDQSVEQTISWLTDGPGHNPWTIAGLSRDFPIPRTLASRAESHQLGWFLRKSNSMSEDVEEVVIAMGKSCKAMRRAFGARIEGTKLFIVQIDDDDSKGSSEPSRAHRGSSGPKFLLGLGPDSIKGGEEIWAAAGAEWPFVIERRPHRKDEEEGAATRFRFKGESFVHGIMQGELFESSAPKWETVILE